MKYYMIETLEDGEWMNVAHEADTKEEAVRLSTFRTREQAERRMHNFKVLYYVARHQMVEYRIVEVEV